MSIVLFKIASGKFHKGYIEIILVVLYKSIKIVKNDYLYLVYY